MLPAKRDHAGLFVAGQETMTGLLSVSTGRAGVRWLRVRIRTRWIRRSNMVTEGQSMSLR